jgi:hypothetical protein
MEYSHWVLRKSNAKSMDIDIENEFAFASRRQKSLKSSKKSDGYGGCFPSRSFIIIRFSIQSIGTI